MNTPGAPGDPAFANLSVLLVEDDAFALKIAQTVLKQLKVPYVNVAKDGGRRWISSIPTPSVSI